MFITTGFTKYEIYTKSGSYIKTVYSASDARWEEMANGYIAKRVNVNSIH